MRRFFSIILALSLTAPGVLLGSSRGTVGFSFLRTQVGARPAGMGGAFVAVPGELQGLLSNPAGVAEIEQRSAFAGYLDHVLDLKSGFVAYGDRFRDLGSYEAAVTFMDYGKMNETDVSGLRTGRTFGAGTVVISAAGGKKFLRNVLVGVTAKYVRSYIDAYSSQALLMDAGVIVHTPVQDLDVGLAVQNVGTVMSAFVDSADALPVCFRIGAAKRLAHLPLLLSFELFKYPDDDFQGAIGGEFTITPRFFLRWGYTSLSRQMKVGTDADQMAGLSLGFGFVWKKYRLDYAFSSQGELGSLNRLGFSAAF